MAVCLYARLLRLSLTVISMRLYVERYQYQAVGFGFALSQAMQYTSSFTRLAPW